MDDLLYYKDFINFKWLNKPEKTLPSRPKGNPFSQAPCHKTALRLAALCPECNLNIRNISNLFRS